MRPTIPFIIKANLVRHLGREPYYNVGVQWTSWPSKRKPAQHFNQMVWEAKQRISEQLKR